VVAAVPHGALEGDRHDRGDDGPRRRSRRRASTARPTPELFVASVRGELVPALVPGQVVAMDNLAPHKVPEVARPVGSAGSRVLLLPPYPPDLDPIEQAFSKVKAYLRQLAGRTVPDLSGGSGEARSAITPADAAAYIRDSGYVLR
jgi:hypothetical protein